MPLLHRYIYTCGVRINICSRHQIHTNHYTGLFTLTTHTQVHTHTHTHTLELREIKVCGKKKYFQEENTNVFMED